MRKIIILFILLFFSFSYIVSSQKVFEVLESEKLSLDLKADDPDADKLVYAFTSPLDKNGEWQTDYGDAGEYKATVTVSDGENEAREDITIQVHRKDERPMIGELFPLDKFIALNENERIRFRIAASDLNNDKLTYTWLINDEFVSDEKEIIFETGYKDSGEYAVEVIVSDGLFNATMEWNVIVNDVNLDAVLQSIQDVTILETETASLNLPNFGKYGLSYEISEPPGNDNKWKTGYNDSGSYDVMVSVKGKDFESVKILKLIVQNKDRPPKLLGLKDVSIRENEDLILEFGAEDPDDDKVAFSVENIPDGASLEGNAFKWRPNFDFVQKENAFDYFLDSFRILSRNAKVNFIAQSNKLKDEKTVRILVKDNNRPFVFEEIDDIVVNEGEEILINPAYKDPDNDRMSFSYSGFMGGNRKRTGFEDAGEYSVKIVASDGYHAKTRFVNVKVNDVNRAPVFDKMTNYEIREGEELRIALMASDPDNDAVIFSSRNMPAGAELKDDLFVWKPEFDAVDGTQKEFNADFIASDGSEETEQKVMITVLNVNQGPKITDFSGNLIAVKGKPLLFYVNATDMDGDELSYGWDFGFLSKFKGGNEHQRIFSSAGTREVKVTVTDGSKTVSKVWDVEVV